MEIMNRRRFVFVLGATAAGLVSRPLLAMSAAATASAPSARPTPPASSRAAGAKGDRMKVGQQCVFESETYRDDLTGRKVTRITPTDCRSHHQYFYLNMWTPDSREVLISSNREDGVYRHYLVNIETGQGICLTDTEHLSSHFGELSHDGRSLLYSAGPQLRRRDMRDMSEVVLYTQPAPWMGGGVYYSATADHSRVIMVEMHREDRVPAKEGWDAFGKQWEVKPRCRLVEADLRTGKARVIHEARCWLGHPNYRPDGRTIMFCHEGPWYLVDSRIWFCEPDGSRVREGRRRAADRPAGEGSGELWGHEYWLADSSHAAFIYFPRRYGVDATIRLLDPDMLAETVLMPVGPYSHFISNRDNTLLVGDGERGLADGLYLVDVRQKVEQVLCRHGSSMKPYINPRTGTPNTQEVHPHPCFSPDSRRVVFSSDQHGSPAVYVVEI
jgi:oligogalacturonide lyase